MLHLHQALAWAVEGVKQFCSGTGGKRKREELEGGGQGGQEVEEQPAKKSRKQRKKARKQRKKAKMVRVDVVKSKVFFSDIVKEDGVIQNKKSLEAVCELKTDVAKVNLGVEEIKKQLETSLKRQAEIRGELGEFRKRFEEKMVEELDEHKKKIGDLQEGMKEQEGKVVEKMEEKKVIEKELEKVKTENKHIGNAEELKVEKEKLKLKIIEQISEQKKLESKLDEIEFQKNLVIKSKDHMEGEVNKLKLIIKEKEGKLQELLKKDDDKASTSGEYQIGLRQKVLKTLNSGSEADLKELATIGPVTALKILDLRNKLVAFKDVADLKALGYAFYVKFVKANHIDI